MCVVKCNKSSSSGILCIRRDVSLSRLCKLVCRTFRKIIILLGNFLPFHGSPKSREGVGSRTMKTISSCPADSVQPPTDYGDYCKPKSERWISSSSQALLLHLLYYLLNGHPYHPCLYCSSLPVGSKNDCRTQSHNVRCFVCCCRCPLVW